MVWRFEEMRSVLERRFEWVDFLKALDGISEFEFLSFYTYFENKVLSNCVGDRCLPYALVLDMSTVSSESLLGLANLCDSFVRVEQGFCDVRTLLDGRSFFNVCGSLLYGEFQKEFAGPWGMCVFEYNDFERFINNSIFERVKFWDLRRLAMRSDIVDRFFDNIAMSESGRFSLDLRGCESFINGFTRRDDLRGRIDRLYFSGLGCDYVDDVDFDELVWLKDIVVSMYDGLSFYLDDFCFVAGVSDAIESMSFLYGDIDDYWLGHFLKSLNARGDMYLDFSGSKITDNFISSLSGDLKGVAKMYLSCSDITSDGFEYLFRKRSRFRWLPESFGLYEVNGFRFWGFSRFDAMNEFYRHQLGRERCYLEIEGDGCGRYYFTGFELAPSPNSLNVVKLR